MNRLGKPLAVLIVSMFSPPSCAPEPPASPAAMVVAAPAGSAEPRRAEILRQIRAICPQPMTAGELTVAADHVEAHPEALPLVKRLDLFDRQSRICRGEKS